ncbi:MAG: chemotaxis protein CheX [Planctomycetes bacterium]|nr:chemotaxis protein CheX [Planctomycetota bacterium]
MNVKYINPFIESLCSVFQTMLSVSPRRDKIRVPNAPENLENTGRVLTSIVGISGAASGVVALRFPVDTALKLTERFLGANFSDVNNENIDAISELANMVAGSAKAKFELDPAPQLSLPSVIEGRGYRVRYPAKAAWLEVPFSTDAGDFVMEVTFSDDSN